jgi:hypothetical protein
VFSAASTGLHLCDLAQALEDSEYSKNLTLRVTAHGRHTFDRNEYLSSVVDVLS